MGAPSKLCHFYNSAQLDYVIKLFLLTEGKHDIKDLPLILFMIRKISIPKG